ATELDAVNSACGNDDQPYSGITRTRTVATELQIGACILGNGGTFTAGSGFTIRSTHPDNKISIEDQVRSATGTEYANYSLNQTGLEWCCLTATYRNSARASVFGDVLQRALCPVGVTASTMTIGGASGWSQNTTAGSVIVVAVWLNSSGQSGTPAIS